MADAGLRPDEYAMYSAVLRAGPLTISELARMVGMPLTTASDYVRTMTTRGHALRSRNPADSRSYLVSLTEDGVAAHSAARVGFADAINRIRQVLPLPSRIWSTPCTLSITPSARSWRTSPPKTSASSVPPVDAETWMIVLPAA
jgi:DNA-binding MarR family transcriptional regulator